MKIWLALLVVWPAQAMGQEIFDQLAGAVLLSAKLQYGGVISWTSVATEADGTYTEDVTAHVVAGVVTCQGMYSAPHRSAAIQGPGLLDISLGLKPDPNAPVPPGAAGQPAGPGAQYVIKVACPNAQYDPTREARWSHGMNTYRQPGGAVHVDPRTKKLIPPETLEGKLTFTGDGGTTTFTWKLCRGCQPPP